MSRKLKVGESVRVNETGEYGVIKGREVVPMEGKRIEIQYVVKKEPEMTKADVLLISVNLQRLFKQ